MKKQRKALIFIIVALVLLTSVISLKNVIAVTYKGYKTTIIDSEGLEIEVATIRSNEVIDSEEYIKANIDEVYAKNDKLVPTDIIMVKQLIAEESKLPEAKTIDAMWEKAKDAFIMLNDTYVLLYDTDDDSDYYVAYVDTMHDDVTSVVTDVSFAYTNLNGEVITDAIYDYETGLAYVPKKYTQENKNGIGLCNVQIELLQAVDSATPTTTFDVVVSKDEDIAGEFATDGSVTVDTINSKFGIKIALDDKAKEEINANYFKVSMNGAEITEWQYYSNEGILVLEVMPSVIETLEVNISQDNIDANVEKMMQNGGISSYAINFDQAQQYQSAGEWTLDALPSEGALITIKGGDYIDVWYDAWDHDSANGNYIHESQLPLYYEANVGSNVWTSLVNKIMNGGTVNANQLGANTTWIQYHVTIKQDVTVTDTNNVSYTIGAGDWLLKCVHDAVTFSTDWWTQIDYGNRVSHSAEIRMRVFEVTNDYILVGMLTSKTHNQTGSGLYKIKYTLGNGNLEVGKKDSYGDYVAGATIRVTGPNGFDKTIVTEAGKPTLFEGVSRGEYTIQEISAPTNMILNSTAKTVTVNAGQTTTESIEDVYQRGSVTLTKYDEDNRGATLGDAVIEGAEFSLYASEDIYEGSHLIYTKDQEIKSGIVTKADGTTDVVTNLPIGKYYYKETKASEGFNINTNNIPVEVVYAGQTATEAAQGYNEAPEKPIYGDVEILKTLAATDYDPSIPLSDVQFELTLKADPNQRYQSNVSGEDGICRFEDIPYGLYTCTEILTNDMAYTIPTFDVQIVENGKTYYFEKEDPVKQMQIEIDKDILVEPGEQTDAVVSGAIFTVYTDAAGKNPYKDMYGNTVVIGPTTEDGYTISKLMRTGTYYLKETTFPKGIDPDAVIEGENVTYRNKIYTVSYNNQTQGTSSVKVTLRVDNEPKRNDIEIIKTIGKTSNTSVAPLDKCEFTATLKSTIGTDNVFSRKCTAETDANGYCIIEDLPYGDYVVEETKVSPISLKCDNFDVNITEDSKVKKDPYSKEIEDEPKVMQIKIRKIDANKKDTDKPDFTQGDGVLKGAIYQIYRYDPQTDDYTEPVYEITVDHKDSEGYWCAESQDLLVGKYMVKEKISYTEVVDGKTINYSYAEGYLADPEVYYFEQQPDLQTEKRTYHSATSKEEIIRGSVEVIKYDNQLGYTDEKAAEGAILRLTLDSNPSKYYDVTINENGYGEFIEEESREKYYPCTIPYGKYTITEVKESNAKEHTSFFIQPEKVTVEKQVQREYRIEADEPVEMYLKIQKTDKITKANVELAGAEFKVWNCQTDSWVSQITYPKGEYISTFVTNNEGNLTLPHKLEAGEYIIYETKAPEGYYLEEAWRIPQNQEDIGNPAKGGKYAKIDKAAMEVKEDTVSQKMDLYYVVYMPNEPLKAKLEIFKTGEMLTEVSTEATEYGEKYTPVYELRGLEGVTYEIRTAEDIMSPDGKVKYLDKGIKVGEITTEEDGFALSDELYVGKYEVKEIAAPDGVIINPQSEIVTLENKDTLKRVEITNKEYTNVRQKLKLSFPKTYDEVNFANGENETKYSVFAVYTNEDIKNCEGNIVISKKSLVDVIRIEGEEDNATSTIDLPEGKYYVQEVDASYPYSLSEDIIDVELKYNGNTNEFVTTRAEGFTNTYDSATLTLIKLSTSSLTDIVLVGDKMDTSKVDEKVAQIINDIKGKPEAEVEKYLSDNNIKFIAGAKYKIYTDEECMNPLYIKENGVFVEAELVTNNTGMIKLEKIPLGIYYVKEVEAPKGYELAENVVKVELNLDNKNKMVYKPLVDNTIKARFMTKTDIFTGEVIPNCTFEIKDMDGNVLLHSVTNEAGDGYIPVDMFEDGETYTYTEIDAPEIYDLNTEPHEFVAKYDEEGNWAVEKIEVYNTRKTIKELIVRKVDDETGEPLQGCKFSIILVDEKTGEAKLDENGENIYLVKEAVTDETGEYIVEKPYYGTYQFIEVEAPEGYELKVDMEGMEFTIDKNSPETVIFEVTNTGDIAVYALSAMAIISVLGIVYVIVKNKKQRV
ncbi:MAG: hypothetical protein J6A15_06560 [Clostridia bacterium]|nr:hypothetical protein [Clostridia bacterium]